MADWRQVASREGWVTLAKSVRVPLGPRKHTVHVIEDSDEIEFYADVPDMAAEDLVDLLVANRATGLAYWHVKDGRAWSVSRCSPAASFSEVRLRILETAALADRLEARLSEIDL